MSSVSIIAADASTLTFDAVVSYTLNSTVEVTEHPVEKGTDISDHAQKKPKVLTLTSAIVTETPYATVSDTGGPDRPAQALAFLDSIAGTYVTVVTDAFGSMANMAITSYPTTRDQIRHGKFDIEFKQVRVVESASVTVAADAPRSGTGAAASLPDAVDAGEQPTTDTAEDPSAEASDKSYLLSIAEALGF